MQTTPYNRPSHTGRNIAIVLIVLFLIVILAFVLFRTPIGSQISYPNVQVSGTVTTAGFGTSPVRIDFTAPNGQVYSAQVTNGQYSLSLPNNQDYAATVTWSAVGTTGTCNGGALNLNVASGSYTWNTSC